MQTISPVKTNPLPASRSLHSLSARIRTWLGLGLGLGLELVLGLGLVSSPLPGCAPAPPCGAPLLTTTYYLPLTTYYLLLTTYYLLLTTYYLLLTAYYLQQHLRFPAVRQWLVAHLRRGSVPPDLRRDAVGVVRPILQAAVHFKEL